MTARRVAADTPLDECPEYSVGLALPDPLSNRVDALVRIVDETGERTSRKELIAALILGASPVGEELAELVRRYREARARDALVNPSEARAVLTFGVRKSGPRPRKRRQKQR